MAADREVLREFLVKLGFDIDERAGRRFVESIGNVTKSTLKTTTALSGLIVATELAVSAFASGMEKLYYASKRTGASAENIQALEYGAQQIGVSAEAARAALENMSRAIRLNPGLLALLKNLGVKTEGRDRVQVLSELVERLGKMPHFAGAQWAAQFGIDEETFLMLKQGLPDLLAAEKKRVEMNKQVGISAEQAASASKTYMNTLRELKARVSVLADALMIALLPSFQDLIQVLIRGTVEFGKWVGENKELIRTNISEFLKGFVGWIRQLDFKKMANELSEFVAGVNKVVKFFGGWETAGLAVAAMMAGPLVLAIGKMAIAMTAFALSPGGLLLSALLAAGAIGYGAGKLINLGLDKAAEKISGQKGETMGSLLEGLVRGNNPGNLRSWGKATVRGGFAQFGTMGEGLSAMAGNLLGYSKKGLVTIRDIVSRWAPAGDNNNTAAYISDVSKQMGLSADRVLNLQNPETLAQLMGAMIRHEQGFNPAGTAELLAAARGRIGGGGPGGGGVVLHQKTDIHIAGGDAASTARAVAGEQNRVNADLVRQAGALR